MNVTWTWSERRGGKSRRARVCVLRRGAEKESGRFISGYPFRHVVSTRRPVLGRVSSRPVKYVGPVPSVSSRPVPLRTGRPSKSPMIADDLPTDTFVGRHRILRAEAARPAIRSFTPA